MPRQSFECYFVQTHPVAHVGLKNDFNVINFNERMCFISLHAIQWQKKNLFEMETKVVLMKNLFRILDAGGEPSQVSIFFSQLKKFERLGGPLDEIVLFSVDKCYVVF